MEHHERTDRHDQTRLTRGRPIGSTVVWVRSRMGEEHRKIAKFIVSGVLKTAAGYGIFLLLLWAGLQKNLAVAGDYVFAVSVGYVVNRSWTFSNQGTPKFALTKYVVAFVLVFALDNAVLEIFVQVGLQPAIARLPSLVVATVASYLLQRYWVFKGH